MKHSQMNRSSRPEWTKFYAIEYFKLSFLGYQDIFNLTLMNKKNWQAHHLLPKKYEAVKQTKKFIIYSPKPHYKQKPMFFKLTFVNKILSMAFGGGKTP